MNSPIPNPIIPDNPMPNAVVNVIDLEQENRRDWYNAFTAMRNDINELIG